MGIQNLIPFLKANHIPVHLSQFAGKTLAIDGYVWLHRGAFSCALELLADQTSTTKYIEYFLKKIEILQKFNIDVFVVLDGDNLPSKSGTESDRKLRREENRKQALKFLYKKENAKALEYARKCIDITPDMARQLVLSLRKLSVKYLVAPYEADAQLAYFMRHGIVQGIITEDSDLLAYGCDNVIFKMENDGSALMINSSEIGLDKQGWSLKKTRHMCILAGCDYVPSLTGVGISKAEKALLSYSDGYMAIKKWKSLGKMINAPKVRVGYESEFRFADLTFQHQRIFDPITKTLTCLAKLPTSFTDSSAFLGPYFISSDDLHNDRVYDDETAFGVAIGDINPVTKIRFSGEVAPLDIFDQIKGMKADILYVKDASERESSAKLSQSKSNINRHILTPVIQRVKLDTVSRSTTSIIQRIRPLYNRNSLGITPIINRVSTVDVVKSVSTLRQPFDDLENITLIRKNALKIDPDCTSVTSPFFSQGDNSKTAPVLIKSDSTTQRKCSIKFYNPAEVKLMQNR